MRRWLCAVGAGGHYAPAARSKRLSAAETLGRQGDVMLVTLLIVTFVVALSVSAFVVLGA
jgi:hypothetical protein